LVPGTTGVARPETSNRVQPPDAPALPTSLRAALTPASAAARSHASTAESVAPAGAAWLPAELDET
jgi:hypothetical protein